MSLMDKVCQLARTPENYLETPHAKKGCEEEIHAAVLNHTLSTQPSHLFSQCLFSVAGSSLVPSQRLSPPPTVCTIRGKPQTLYQIQYCYLAPNWGLPHYEKKPNVMTKNNFITPSLHFEEGARFKHKKHCTKHTQQVGYLWSSLPMDAGDTEVSISFWEDWATLAREIHWGLLKRQTITDLGISLSRM